MNTVSTICFLMKKLTKYWKSIDPDCFIYLCILAVTFLWTHWLFCRPFVWKKSLQDIKCSLLRKQENDIRFSLKRDTINRLRKVRNGNPIELPPPYPNGWYGILESCKLSAGEATFVSCLGEELVIFRTQKNKIFILDAYCPHLGANLGIGGKVIDDCVVCPFHQWSFRGSDGTCTNIPYSTSVPKGSNVKNWSSQEMNGYIFIWYHTDPTEIPWELPLSTEELKTKYFYHGHNEFYIHCHIQEIPENGSDIAHFNAIHKESLIDGIWATKKFSFNRCGYHHWKARWFPTPGKLKHLAEVHLHHTLELFGKFYIFRMDVCGKQVSINIFFKSFLLFF